MEQIYREPKYTVAFRKTASASGYGFTVSAAGENRKSVIKQAMTSLREAQAEALKVHSEFLGDLPKPKGEEQDDRN